MFSKASFLFLSFALLSVFTRATITHRKMVAGMPGGYYAADANDSRVIEASKFAVQSLNSSPYPQLTSSSSNGSCKIVEASQQVVAGMNYRLKIQVQNEQQQCVGTFVVTVYDRFGTLTVTEWGEANIPCPPVTNSVVDSIQNEDTSEIDPDT